MIEVFDWTMEFFFEIFLQFFGEIIVQVLAELLAEFGIRSLADPVREPRTPVYSMVGYTLWGLIAGAISLFLFPASAIRNPAFRTINLVVTPLVIAAIMAMLGRARNKRGQLLVRLDRFGYAYLFAFSMALVRFIWAS
ncbi:MULTISPECIES: hypothetical protein [Novosphingobium]|uniref:Uncharacterized protein n=1 Tax=Novosphingobium subterraneum TaxID=48936 RepID=A0A0B9A1H3_9SPHN|nr:MULTISPECIES: hypothetical protein [Novosphingobium]KHS43198.1 hypothetical protein NJ75_03827 [Novosphingobium subterraneum]